MSANLNRYTQSKKEQIIQNQILINNTYDQNLVNKITLFNLEDFLPSEKVYLANSDSYIEYSEGRYIMDIHTIAQLLSITQIEKTDKVLLLGLGVGYLGAILSTYINEIQAYEADIKIMEQAEKNLYKYNISNVEILTKQRFTKLSPQSYNYIIINGAFSELPQSIINLLISQGSVIGIERKDNLSKLVQITSIEGKLLKNYYSQVPMPFLKGFEPTKKFIF